MSDLISRQDALKLVDQGYLISNGNYQKVRKMVESLPSAEPRWIPCREWLPEEGERVILRYSNGKISGGTYVGRRTFDIDFGDTDPAVSVVAWMPMP